MMRKFATRIMNKITGKTLMAKAILRSQCGENFVDTAIKILMAVSSADSCWPDSMPCLAKRYCRP